MREVRALGDGIHWVGVRDWERRMFDALIPLPYGTTYNSYLVQGSERTALIDTVNPGFEAEFREKVDQVGDLRSVDYLVMNHAEPDHAGAIPYVMRENQEVKLVLTEKGAKLAQALYRVEEERMMVVKDGDTLSLGGKTLRFIEAPFLHWPETMFSYAEEDRVLFPCDFFGAHMASGDFTGDVEDYLLMAKKYYGEIMMPFSKMGQRGVEKASALGPRLIAPSHGPVHDDPQRILDAYRTWTAGQTREKATIAYISMWGATEKLVDTMAETLLQEGIEVKKHNLGTTDIATLAGDLVDSRAIVLGAPTVLGGLHPLALYGASLVRALRPPAKYAALLSSYGWGGGAAKQAVEILEPTKIELIGAVDVLGRPKVEDLQKVVEVGKALANKIKGHC